MSSLSIRAPRKRWTVDAPRELPTFVRLDEITDKIVWSLIRRSVHKARRAHNDRLARRRRVA